MFVKSIKIALVLSALFTSVLHTPSVFSETPADSQIKNALYDIDRYEQQIAGKTTLNKATANRTLKLLRIADGNLKSSPNKQHPSWQEANNRLIQLVAKINALAGNTASSNSSASSSAKAVAGQKVAPPANQKPRTQQKPPASGQQMISHQRVQLRKLTRDVKSSTSTMDSNGPKPFQSAEYVQKRSERLNYFVQALSRFANFPADPDYLTAKQAVTVYENMLNFGKQHARKELESLGNVQARLEAISKAMNKVPAAPQYPYAGSIINDWVIALARTRKTAEQALPHLNDILQRAYLPNTPATRSQGAAFDANDVNSLIRGYNENIRNVDQSLEQFKVNLHSQVNHIADTLAYFDALNPADSNQQINAFLGKGAAAENRARLAETKQLAEAATGFSKLINSSNFNDYNAILSRVNQTSQTFEANLEKASKLVRLPKPASTDRSLLKIAKETLSNPNYDIGEVKRLVINSQKNHYEKETSEDKYDSLDVSLSGDITLTGTRTTYFYSWDQFQVATAEKGEDGKHFIYYTTLKLFSKGAPSTPLNRWIVAGRIQGSQIPEANIEL